MAQRLQCLITVKKNDEPTPIFPPEVVIEIMSWLPLKYLTRLQLVCKQWRAIATDHYFIEKHMAHSPVIWHLHNVEITHYSNYSPDQETYSYVHGSVGFLLLKSYPSAKYILWNPATRLVLKLPDPRKGSHGFALSFLPATGNYRIVSFYNDAESGLDGCEIFTPGQSQAWRHLTFPRTANANIHRVKGRGSVVSTGGVVHWVSFIKVGDEVVEQIVSLDTETELFTVNHLPIGLFYNWSTVRELGWNGKLAFADIVGKSLEVMELEDYKKQRWSLSKKVIPLSFMKKYKDGERINLYPLLAEKGDIWFWLKDEEIFTYTIETGKVTHIRKSETFSLRTNLHPYKPSLITFQGMVADTMVEKLRGHLGFD